MKLWVFGHSGCLPFNLPGGLGWVDQIAQSLNIEHENFAEAGADNLFIYHSIINNLKFVQKNDIVIVGWSHPNRKSFVLDRTHPVHKQAIDKDCMIFNSNPEFFRSKGGVVNDTKQKWSTMIPTQQGNEFFDTWFNNYHNAYECRLNLQAYCDSVQHCIPCRYLPFYFSQESINYPSADSFYWLDFVIKNQVWISESDMHPNQQGHNKIAKIFLQLLNNQSK